MPKPPAKLLFGALDWPNGWDADVEEGSAPKLSPGDIVVNGWASLDNPRRVGIYVETNEHIRLTNGMKTWSMARGDSQYGPRYAVIGNLREVIG